MTAELYLYAQFSILYPNLGSNSLNNLMYVPTRLPLGVRVVQGGGGLEALESQWPTPKLCFVHLNSLLEISTLGHKNFSHV